MFCARDLPSRGARKGEEDRLAHHASALKHMRQSLKRRGRNRRNLSLVKSRVRKLREALAKGDAKAARELLPETFGEIDRAAKKGVVHDNAAARYKSRLARRVNALAPRT
jgi:small subunit ribosomal protein S20